MADPTLDPKHADKRTFERYLRNGELEEKAWNKHLEALPDVAEKAVPIESLLEDDGDTLDEDDEA